MPNKKAGTPRKKSNPWQPIKKRTYKTLVKKTKKEKK